MEYGFSPKNQQNCTASENLGQWKSIFTWTPAKWYTGVQRSPTWNNRQVILIEKFIVLIHSKALPRYSWSNTIDLLRVEHLWESGISLIEAVQSKVCFYYIFS